MTQNTRLIPLTQGRSTIVDAADYEWLMQWKWHANRQANGAVYASRKGRNDSHVRMHRFIMSAPKGMLVDHINHDTLDNRRANLRLCTNAGNKQNCTSAKGSSSKYIGVSWEKDRRKWGVSVRVGGKKKHVGRFTDEITAAKAYDTAARSHYGEFANPNFPV